MSSPAAGAAPLRTKLPCRIAPAVSETPNGAERLLFSNAHAHEMIATSGAHSHVCMSRRGTTLPDCHSMPRLEGLRPPVVHFRSPHWSVLFTSWAQASGSCASCVHIRGNRGRMVCGQAWAAAPLHPGGAPGRKMYRGTNERRIWVEIGVASMPRRRFRLAGQGWGAARRGRGARRTVWEARQLPAGVQRWHVARWGRKQGKYTASGAGGQAGGVGGVRGAGAGGGACRGRDK